MSGTDSFCTADTAVWSDGWLLETANGQAVQRIKSPNFDARPADAGVSLVVIHAISLPPQQFGGDGIFQLFTNTLNPDEHPFYRGIHSLRVASHFLVRRGGEIVQFVSCNDRAWHAGISCWQGRERCNDFSIGIELEGSDFCAFEDVQYQALKMLMQAINEAYPNCDVAGHSEIAPGRKTDPGPFFEWSRLTP